MKYFVSFLVMFAIITAYAGCKNPSGDKPADSGPQTDVIQPAPAGDTITNFRFERYDIVKGEPVRSAVYTAHQYKISEKWYQSMYFRRYGTCTENNGWNYSGVDLSQTLPELEAAINSLQLTHYKRSFLEQENKKRSRWVVQVVYQSGAKIEIIEYLPKGESSGDNGVCKALEPIFDRLIKYTLDNHRHGEYTQTSYKPDGKWKRRIRHDRDGRVCGGEDADTKGLKF